MLVALFGLVVLTGPVVVLTVLPPNMVGNTVMFSKRGQQTAWHPKCETTQVRMNSRRAKGRRTPEVAIRKLIPGMGKHKSMMITRIPVKEKMELMTFMPMLLFTTQLLVSFSAKTDKDPEMIKERPPQIRYPDAPSTDKFQYM